MNRLTKPNRFLWLWYLVWALFVNAVNEWMITPLVEDYAILGVVAVVALIVIWLTSIPATSRKRWIGFTLFSLLIGQGLAWLAYFPLSSRIPLTLIMVIGLLVVTWLFARIGVRTLIVSILVLCIANILLPVNEWPFLTHFQVQKYGAYNIVPGDLSALPFATIDTPTGQAIITLKRVDPSSQELQQLAANATGSADQLGNVLSTYKDEYRLVEISDVNGHIEESVPSRADVAKVNPFDLVTNSFPFSMAHWVLVNHQIVQYMTPTMPAQTVTSLGVETAIYPTNMVALSIAARQEQLQIWQQFLQQLGVQAVNPPLQVANGRLEGAYAGNSINVSVQAGVFVTTGSFTAPGTHQALVEGANTLQVVDLDANKVVATYHSDATHPVTNDIVAGPLAPGDADAIFVNASPAYILQASSNGDMQLLYTAPNQSLRFEADMTFPGDHAPEIITDDPSYYRDAPTRYFTSYTYRGGNLVRNWRVYRTNVVNVQPVQLTNGSTPDLMVGIYGTGQYLLLKRWMWPVMPLAIALLGLIIIGGWVQRYRTRGRRFNA